MLLKNKLRSVYSRAVHGNVIAINEHDTGRSVTNDAENVINDLVRQGFDLSPYHAIYKDTRGIWDQILVDRTGRFAGFSSRFPDPTGAKQRSRNCELGAGRGTCCTPGHVAGFREPIAPAAGT
jgi:hypothetical protein